MRMALEETERLGLELVVPVGEEGGAGEARGAQVADDVLGVQARATAKRYSFTSLNAESARSSS
ncbi:hypothetical protein [Streptomyces sp. NPDC001436]